MGRVLLPEQEEGHCDYGTWYHRKRGGQGAGKGQSIEGLKVTEKINNTIRDIGGQCTVDGVLPRLLKILCREADGQGIQTKHRASRMLL